MISRIDPKVFVNYRYLGELDEVKVREFIGSNNLIGNNITYEITDMGVNVGPQTKASDKVIQFFIEEYELKSDSAIVDRQSLPQDVYITSISNTLPLSDRGLRMPESEMYSPGLIENTPQFEARLKEEFPNLKVVLYDTKNFIGGFK